MIAHIYPKGHERRVELIEEMKHVNDLGHALEQWRWLGEQFPTAVCDGFTQRL